LSAFVRQLRLVTQRELGATLTMPLYFVLTGLFFMLAASVFLASLVDFAKGSDTMSLNVTDAVLRPTFHTIHFFMLVQIPLLTMRLFAEDRANGMLDLLQTTPLNDWALLLGKYLATWLAQVVFLSLALLFPACTAFLGTVEWPIVIGSWLALVLLSSGYVAVGMFFSSLTESAVLAGVLSYVGLFVLAFGSAFAGASVLGDFARHFTVVEHVNAFFTGNLAWMNLCYFTSLTAFFLFLTARSLESRRWRA